MSGRTTEGRRQRTEVLSRLHRAVFQRAPRSGTQLSVLIKLLAIRLGHLKTIAKSLVICLLSFVLCYAEELPDPTRPATPTMATGGNPSSGLKSIIISKTRRAAIIDGETVELRGKHGGSTLIEVNETGVVLQGAQGRQVLTLFPNVKVMQKEIQATPKMSVKEGGVAQNTKLKTRKERK